MGILRVRNPVLPVVKRIRTIADKLSLVSPFRRKLAVVPNGDIAACIGKNKILGRTNIMSKGINIIAVIFSMIQFIKSTRLVAGVVTQPT